MGQAGCGIPVNCCGAASGKMLPPYVVYNSKDLYKDWILGGPDGAVIMDGWRELCIWTGLKKKF